SIEKVGIDEQKKSALVVVADSQLSLAIGKNGQNVRLAAKLTGWKIDIISSTEYEKQKLERDQEIKAALAEEAAQITENPVGSTKEPEISSQEEGVETPAVVPTESGQSSGS
ncbi:MAG: KH domain-containing protein, partial [Nitrospira sp.]|nr:KH domain-containing protein [Nitrospira sp.]